ncbi:hypothetical protein KEM55_007586, partial [Ascosphaera atra]
PAANDDDGPPSPTPDASRTLSVPAQVQARAGERAQRTAIPLPIPFEFDERDVHVLDNPAATSANANANATPSRTKLASKAVHLTATASASHRRKEAAQRDTSKRREALLRGKEGSRRRQRWENDRLLNNPWAQPPDPSDWDITPTYPRHAVPYHLAPLWDAHYAKNVSSKHASKPANEHQHFVPREFRAKLKHARAARGILKDLEEEVRSFIVDAENAKARVPDAAAVDGVTDDSASSSPSELDTSVVNANRYNALDVASSDDDDEGVFSDPEDGDEEEIVFAGRDRAVQRHFHAHHTQAARASAKRPGQRMILDSLVDDQGASFGRWIVHCLAAYYGLRTWSVTVGDRREAYVGLPLAVSDADAAHAKARSNTRTTARDTHGQLALPRPLW